MDKRYRIIRISVIFLLFLTGLNALVAGLLFMIEPSGQLMGMSTLYLTNSPFSTFLIPGIILFFVNGVLNILAAILTIKKHKKFPTLIIIQGILLSGWILIQVALVRDFNPLHFIMVTIGVLLIVLGLYLKTRCKL